MKVTDDLPRWVMWPLRLLFYAFVLFIVASIAQTIARARLQSNIDECAGSSRSPSSASALERIRRLSDCLDRKNGIFENFVMSPARKAIDALSNHPSEFVGKWNSSQPHCRYRFQLMSSGEFDAEPVKCSLSTKRFHGAWGVYENQMVWLDDNEALPASIDPIEAQGKNAFILVERDGSRTHFTRIVETPETLARTAPVAEEPIKIVPLPEGTMRLPFDGAAPFPGALAISTDGSTAAHIALNGDIEVWLPTESKRMEIIPANGKRPSSVAINGNGDLIAIGYFDSRVVVWSRSAHKVMHQFDGASGGISALAFSRDAKLLGVGSDDGTTGLWKLSSGKRLRIFDSKEGGTVVALGFTGDGAALIVNEWYSRHYDVGRGITLWDIKEDIEISTRDVSPPNGDNNALRAGQALGGRGWLLAFTGSDGLMVERLDLCAPPRQLPSGQYADTVISDTQGRWVAATEDEKLTFFGMSDDKESQSVTLPGKAIALAPHPDGRSVFALMIDEARFNGNRHFIAGRDANIVTKGALYQVKVPEQYWNLPPLVVNDGAGRCPPTAEVRKKQNLKVPEAPTELASIAKLVPTKEMTADPDNPTGEHNRINPPRELYFGRDRNLYALYHAKSDFRSGVAVWDLETNQLLRGRFKQHVPDNIIRLSSGWGAADEILTDLLTGMRLSSVSNDDDKNRYVGLASDPDTGQFFRLTASHIERYSAEGHRMPDINIGGGVVDYAVRNGRLAVLYQNGNVQVWQLASRGESKTYKLGLKLGGDDYWAEELALSADGRYLRVAFPNASGDGPTQYVTYRLNSAEPVGDGDLLAPFPIRANRGVVADTRPHHLAVWDFDKGGIIAHLPRHPGRDKGGQNKPLLAAMSEDGRLLASASNDGLVRVWNLDARQMLGEAHIGGAATAMVFDATGLRLAVGREDGHLIVLQVSSSATPKTQRAYGDYP